MKKKVLLIIALIIIVLIVIVGIIYYSINLTLKIGTEKLKLNISSSEEIINLNSFTSEKIDIKKYGFSKVKINNTKIDNKYRLENFEINKENLIKIDVSYLFGKINKTYFINTLPEDFPKYKVSGESRYEGDYYFTTYNNIKPPYYLIKLDEKGNILYYKKTDEIAFDFKKQYIEGKTRYTYLQTLKKSNLKATNKSYCPTELIIMNENYEVIDKVRFINKDGTTQPLENHGSMVLGENHYILATFKEEIVDNIPESAQSKIKNNKITNNIIEEVKDGKILWQFQTKDYPELYEYYNDVASQLTVCKDYAHYNSASVDMNDGNLLCSYRHLNAILKINRQTGDLMWVLGGKGDQFGLKEEQQFAKQHAVTSLEDGSILIFNNDTYKKDSTIIKIKLDEENKKVLDYKSYNIEENSIFMGSAQLLKDNPDVCLICYGGVMFNKHNLLEEVNLKTKETYFTFDFSESKYMFRAYKIK